MEDKDLCDMIHMKWLEKSKIDFSSHTQVLLYKFKNLKFDVIDWEKWKTERNQEALILIETELNDMSDMVDDKNKLFDNNKSFISLLVAKGRVLKQHEETMRLKGCVVWLQSKDKNTNFFQNHANQRRIINSIWELKDQNVVLFSDRNTLEEWVVSFFIDVYL